MTERQIAPGLLVAMPQLSDPNFERCVVLMVEHSAEGSWGLIMNRPSDVSMSDVLQALEIEWAGDPEAMAWTGGPVQPRSGWLLHQPIGADPDLDEESVEIAPGIALSTSPVRLREIASSPPDRVRFMLGYAGWGAGQLEAEMAMGAWINAEVTPAMIFDTAPAAMWEQALRSLGIEPTSLVPARGIH